MSDNEDYSVGKKDAEVVTLHTPEPWKIIFRNDRKEDVGTLKFDDEGRLHFHGQVEDSARIFFNAVIAGNNRKMKELEKEIGRLKAKDKDASLTKEWAEGYEPDWMSNCEVCGATPIVPLTGMCGPCTFGEADTAGGNW